MTHTSINAGQSNLCLQLVYSVAASWSGPMPADLADKYRSHDARLRGVVHSLFVELQGCGGIEPHRLSPKDAPEVDLLRLPWSLEHEYPLTAEARLVLRPAAAVDLLQRIEDLATDAIARRVSYHETIGLFLGGICRLFEDGYVLVSQFFDEDGDLVGEGKDMAPGLGAAFAATWAEATVRAKGR